MLREWTVRILRYQFYVLLTVHHDIPVQYEPTGCTFYFQFISIINFYMFRAGLLLITRRYYSVYTAIGTSMSGSCQQPVNINGMFNSFTLLLKYFDYLIPFNTI
jgi:hypothetical protein